MTRLRHFRRHAWAFALLTGLTAVLVLPGCMCMPLHKGGHQATSQGGHGEAHKGTETAEPAAEGGKEPSHTGTDGGSSQPSSEGHQHGEPSSSEGHHGMMGGGTWGWVAGGLLMGAMMAIVIL